MNTLNDMGWVCPKCYRGVSPYVLTCPCCDRYLVTYHSCDVLENADKLDSFTKELEQEEMPPYNDVNVTMEPERNGNDS